MAGLWLAVTMRPQGIFLVFTVYIRSGVGEERFTINTRKPFAVSTSASQCADSLARKRLSYPTAISAPDCPSCSSMRQIPAASSRRFSLVKPSAITARQPPVPNLIMICTFLSAHCHFRTADAACRKNRKNIGFFSVCQDLPDTLLYPVWI